MADSIDNAVSAAGLAKGRTRSPAYPGIGLEDALGKAQTMYEESEQHPMSLSDLAALWDGVKTSSSGFQVSVAALKQFGLITDEGSGEDRQVRITDLARDIFIHTDEDSQERRDAIRRAALTPRIHAELWAKYSGKLPPGDSPVRVYLIKGRKDEGVGGPFNKDVVDAFIRQFRSTVAFAGLVASDTISPADDGSPADGKLLKAGDFVQWTINGADQFATPRQIKGISDGGDFAFVDGTQTGLPMKQLTKQGPLVTPAPTGGGPPPLNPFFKPEERRDDVLPGAVEEKKIFDEGAALLRWPDKLSKESVEDFEYWVKGILRRLRRKAGLPEKGD